MRYTLIACFAAVLALSGCAGMPAADSRVAELHEIAVRDVAAARVLAQRANDRIALQCYEYIQTRLTSGGNEPINVEGVISGFQLARNGHRAVSGADEELRMACAPLAMDSPVIRRLLGLRGLAGAALGAVVP